MSGLEIVACATFAKVWDDRRTGASRGEVSIWHVVPPPRFYSIGDYAESQRGDVPEGTAIVVREAVEGSKLLAPPIGYIKKWDDRGTGGSYGNVSFWSPVPPTGYVALGDVAISDHSDVPPSLDAIRCVHESLVTVGRWDYPHIWSDAGSGGQYGDASLWRPAPMNLSGTATSTFKAEWAHCFPLIHPPFVLRDPNTLKQSASPRSRDTKVQGRKITLMSHHGRFLRVRKSGEAETGNWSGVKDGASDEPEETWTMIRKYNKASFINKHGRYLSCKPTGELEGVEAKSGEREEFEVSIVNRTITIKSCANNRYITVPRSSTSDLVGAYVDKPYSWIISFMSVSSGVSAMLISSQGLYLSARQDGSVAMLDTKEPGPTERWTLNEDQRRLTLLSNWGCFLSADGDRVHAKSPVVTEAELFRTYEDGPSRLRLNSKPTGRTVNASGNRIEMLKNAPQGQFTVLLSYDVSLSP